MNLDELQIRADAAERLLKAMASRPRLMILCELLKGERTVTALHQAVESLSYALAGLVVLVSLALAQTLSPLWLLLTAFVGLNLIQASFTGFCPAAMVFKRLGVKAGKAFT